MKDVTKVNGNDVDQGLMAINMAFKDAKYLCAEAKECAELMMIGKHRELELSDSNAMMMYGSVTEGKKFILERIGKSGRGYRVQIESYADLRDFFNGTIEGYEVAAVKAVTEEPEVANDG